MTARHAAIAGVILALAAALYAATDDDVRIDQSLTATIVLAAGIVLVVVGVIRLIDR